MKTTNNFSTPNFKAVYTNSKTVDLLDTYITHGAPNLTQEIIGSVKILGTLTNKLNTDVVIEKGTDEFTARIVEVKDHIDKDCYKIIDYLTKEEKLPNALSSAIKKLTARKNELEKANKPIRQRFPGRNTLDIKG